MKWWVYPDEDLVALGPQRSGLRFAGPGVERVERAGEADVLVVPVPLSAMPEMKHFSILPNWSGRETSHVAMECSDHPDDAERSRGAFMYEGCRAMLIRCNVRPWMVSAAPNTLACAWPTGRPDLDAVAEEGEPSFTHDVGYHAWLYSDARKAAWVSLTGPAGAGLRLDVKGHADFSGYLPEDGEEWKRRRAAFVLSMRRCRLQICPQSIPGVQAYRFYETLCCARVPVLFCTGQVLPFADEIPWGEFTYQFPAEDAGRAAEIVRMILASTPDERLAEMGRLGRRWFLDRLDNRRWPEIHALMVERRARQLGLVR